jgi:hypothetical protein
VEARGLRGGGRGRRRRAGEQVKPTSLSSHGSQYHACA